MGRLAKLGSDHGVQAWARLFGGAPDFGQRPDSWKPTPTFGVAGERIGRIRQPLDRDIDRPYGQQKPVPGGSYGRSALTSQGNAFVRLLQAMRSNAPGGWSDDRYEQTLRHFVGITYVAIHRLSTQFSRAEFQVFHEDPDDPEGKRPVRRGERAWELVQLLKRPNKQDTFGRLMYRWSLQRRLTGTALTWVVPNALGDPFEIYSIPTALAIPQAATNPDYPEGFYRIQPIYPYGPFSSFPAPASSVGAPISAQWMMRFQYPHPLLRYEGYSPLTGMRLHIDALEMVDRARHYLMRRGIHPSAVLNSVDAEAGTNELDETEIERIRADFEAGHMGPENYGRLFVAYAGWKLENWGNPPSEMAFDSSWDQLSSFILGGGFGITKQAAGMIEDSSYSTLFATLKQLHLVTIEPECEDIGAELTRFLGPFFGDDLIVEVRAPRIDDHELKHQRLSMAIQGKCITKNQLLRELELPTTTEPWGDDIAGEMPQQQQQGMGGMPGMPAPGGMPGAPAEQPQPAGGGMESQEQEEPDPLAALLGVEEEPGEETRPTPGALGEGALGPRKRFQFNGSH